VRRLWICSSTLAVLAAATLQNAGAAAPKVGSVAPELSANDYLGAEHSLSKIGQDKIVVLAFLGTECPLATLYTPRLVELDEQYGTRGVVFVGVNSNRQDSVTEIAAYVRRHKVSFPMLKDLRQQIADAVGATRTPQIVVLDAERRIRYRGRIDDQFGFVKSDRNRNYQKPEAEHNDLTDALDTLLAGKEVVRTETELAGCLIGRDRQPSADSEVTYAKHIAPILNTNCVYCHREGQIGPFTLNDYDEVAGWADMIKEVVDANRMPPWHADPAHGKFANAARLSDADKALISQWVAAGAPEGDPSDLPEPPQFTEGWMIDEPDQVFAMAEEPYEVPAEGVVEYQHFLVDPGWDEDKWITAIEARPGNPAVVHHILIFVRTPDGRDNDFAGDNEFIGAYAPGFREVPLENGLARFVPAGSKFVVQLHYTPNGSPQQDLSHIGVVFADQQEVKKEVIVSSAMNAVFQIPPEAHNHAVQSRYVFKRDAHLLSLMPHMHLRGKDFQYEAVYPDGKREIVLSVPNYDFGWQTSYRLAEPKLMPRGTILQCSAHFDNSSDNLNNPDPSITVGWGDQTWEEMMIGFFEAAPVEQDLTDPKSRQPTNRSRVEDFAVIMQATKGQPDENLKVMTYLSLNDMRMMSRFRHVLQMMAPQVDRVCVTSVEDGKAKQFLGPFPPRQRGDNPPPERISSVLPEVDAADEPLAKYRTGKTAVAHNDLTQVEGEVFETMKRRGVRSSMHVPVVVGGEKMTINFWSSEPGGFPKPAVQFLTAISQAMAAPHADAQKTASVN